jgi:amino acid transporter
MGENGVFFRRLGEVHPFSKTPVIALVLQGILSIVLMFLLDIEK